jgi:hypothetical protein
MMVQTKQRVHSTALKVQLSITGQGGKVRLVLLPEM